jgi:sulfur relay (sulfurtransferase) complex TusBCD TusD component (DsrE family)
MLNISSKLKHAAIIPFLTIVGFTSNVVKAADVSSGDGFEKVVISLGTDPTKDPEPACVALQIGMNLLMSIPAGGIPADEVTLFLTTGGVELINPNNSIYNRAKPKPVCTTPDGIKTASLQQLLLGFEGLLGKVVICPLCATSRGITEPETGEMGSAVDIHNLFLEADKVIDF